MVTSLYTSADMKIDFNVSFEPADFGNLRVIIGYFFKANPTVRSLYTSADMEKDIFITSFLIQWMDFKVSGVILGFKSLFVHIR